jgi:NAD+ kinase
LKIALFTKLNPKENNQHIFSVINSLRKASLKFEIDDLSYEILKKNKSIIIEEKIKTYTKIDETFDFVLAIGGDGTILESAKLIGKMSTPIIGLNKGRLGFLANSNTDDINQILSNVKLSKFQISERTIIKGIVNGIEYNALNEISVSRKNTTSLITIETKLNQQFLNTYWADGLIVSTPTGSTGYSLSCGGPIIMPESKNLVLTPIAPHNLNARPLVIPDDKEISISIKSREDQYFISIDSDIISASINSEIVISKANQKLNMVEFDDNSFIKSLKDKLMWGKDKRTKQ